MFFAVILPEELPFCKNEIEKLQKSKKIRYRSHVCLDYGSWGMFFAAEGLRAVAAVPSSSKTMPQDLTYTGV